MSNYVQRFLLEKLDIRGAVVHLDSVWQEMLSGRNYPQPVTKLLGEMSAVTLLLGENLKQTGRLTIQLTGSGPISMLILDCTESLHLRGMAKCEQTIEAQSVPDLLGRGHLLITLDMTSMRESYQSIVPLDGNTISEIFEHYFKQSDQLPSRLFLVTANNAIFGLLLQKMPDADARDPDGWIRAEALANTIHDHKLFDLTAEEILTRLFHEETIRIFDTQSVEYGCQEDIAKIYAMLRTLGREEVDSILKDFGEVIVSDDICNCEYRLDALAIDAIFREAGPTVH
ncbi:Hsp33 family molecular chaperone HslO [Nitrosomonas supralitoralis]|uniref:Molecular chaperone Hsp33 n=1 Tax=Nitrosomonas supralitoralis TaxID=2116706 RepID=A0A2P7NY64_9PROT|nr:Hsp33 family molecular chaperone HslO [Nitrosomonas supralitoralis]PSJ18410.1 molecular chaperone Hsp33 [Nitrosomonas supralitoralis]